MRRAWAMLKVSYYCFKAALWLRVYLSRRERAERRELAAEADRLGLHRLAADIRKNRKGVSR